MCSCFLKDMDHAEKRNSSIDFQHDSAKIPIVIMTISPTPTYDGPGTEYKKTHETVKKPIIWRIDDMNLHNKTRRIQPE